MRLSESSRGSSRASAKNARHLLRCLLSSLPLPQSTSHPLPVVLPISLALCLPRPRSTFGDTLLLRRHRSLLRCRSRLRFRGGRSRVLVLQLLTVSTTRPDHTREDRHAHENKQHAAASERRAAFGIGTDDRPPPPPPTAAATTTTTNRRLRRRHHEHHQQLHCKQDRRRARRHDRQKRMHGQTEDNRWNVCHSTHACKRKNHDAPPPPWPSGRQPLLRAPPRWAAALRHAPPRSAFSTRRPACGWPCDAACLPVPPW
jgi:hypothetical protein